jgi:hypothetical protein
MIKSSLPAAILVALTMTVPFTSQALANKSAAPDTRTIGREVAAPPWSFACINDQGPHQCDEPVWVYGSSADVSRRKSAF